MIASLPMYWRPSTQDAWQVFWDGVQQIVDLPDLTPPSDLPGDWTNHWLRPDLALSMTCGLPFRSVLKDRVQYVGTFDFNLGGAPGYYHSVIVAQKGSVDHLPAHPTLAFNSDDSQSGWAVSQSAAPFQLAPSFGRYLRTGSHAASVAAVAEGLADIAYIDAVSWRLLSRDSPETKMVTELGRSVETPGLPLISALDVEPAAIRHALKSAIRNLSPSAAHAMGGLAGFHVLPVADYHKVPLPRPAPHDLVSAY